MTEKLYYEKQSIYKLLDRCRATVLACEKAEDGYDILLDRTVIYPEGGGQPSDTGRIGDAVVSHAREVDGEIWHRADRPIPAGEPVEVAFDPERRLDHSQQHTGEHILSGLAHTLFGAVNVGFHMAKDYSTIDFDLPLDEEQLRRLEWEANRAVQRNVETEVRIVSDAELESIPLRKRAKDLEGDDIRIVWCGGVDSCTCCGIHCVMSGEVGAIKITAHMNYKGGTRLWFACGMRAVEAADKNAGLVDKLARRFSTKPENALDAVVKQGDELAALKRDYRLRTDALLGYRAAALLQAAEAVGGAKLIVHGEDGLSAQELKTLGEKLCKAEKAVAVLFSRMGETMYYQLCRAEGVELSMREICAALNAITGGKGGGRDDAAQGSARAHAGFEEMTAQFTGYMKQRMKGG